MGQVVPRRLGSGTSLCDWDSQEQCRLPLPLPLRRKRVGHQVQLLFVPYVL